MTLITAWECDVCRHELPMSIPPRITMTWAGGKVQHVCGSCATVIDKMLKEKK